uniref:Uncharacterized protein n=1 Tax=Cyanothece sp. (strain PCC 7425 / ATCC 29141) TaxID=395961 RepID=B8HMY4_CYAP4
MINTNINLENCPADLENLAYQIYTYLQMRDFCDDQEQVNRQFATVLRNLKTNSIIYTDVASPVMAVAKPITTIAA